MQIFPKLPQFQTNRLSNHQTRIVVLNILEHEFTIDHLVKVEVLSNDIFLDDV